MACLQVVVPNALSVLNVAKTKHVSTKNALTLVLALVALMQDVKFSITIQSVVAQLVTRAIHSYNVFWKEVSSLSLSIDDQPQSTTYNFLEPVVEEPTGDPCVPSPCGPYSACRVVGNLPACSCLPNYIGRSPNCRPECTINAECSSNLACINEKCADPCIGSCGINSICTVVKHSPVCQCKNGFSGDPFSVCSEIQYCKLHLSLTSHILYFNHFLKQNFEFLSSTSGRKARTL